MEGVKTYIKEQVKSLAFATVNDDQSLIASRLLDSIIVVDLAVAIEEKYKVKIPFTEISPENFETVNHIIKYLESKGIQSGSNA